MAISYNRAVIIGRVGKDPEARGRDDGMTVFTVATSEYWKDKQTGERQERTQWHNVVIFNQVKAKFALEYLKKGDQVLVEGQVETREYEHDGQKKRITEIVVRPFGGDVQIQSKDRGDRDESSRSSAPRQNSGPENFDSGRRTGGFSRDLDDEIPF